MLQSLQNNNKKFSFRQCQVILKKKAKKAWHRHLIIIRLLIGMVYKKIKKINETKITYTKSEDTV